MKILFSSRPFIVETTSRNESVLLENLTIGVTRRISVVPEVTYNNQKFYGNQTLLEFITENETAGSAQNLKTLGRLGSKDMRLFWEQPEPSAFEIHKAPDYYMMRLRDEDPKDSETTYVNLRFC